MTWLKDNFGTTITIATFVVTMVVNWTRVQVAVDLANETAARFRIHEMDTGRHIDRERDERWQQELIRRLDRMEAKIDARDTRDAR